MIPFARNLSYLGTGEDLRKATTHLLAHTLASTMDRVDAYLVGNWRRQARFKLQDDAVATSILGRLCEQFPEVFQTHVMPHLQDADLRSLIVLLGSVPRSVIRTLSGAEEVGTSRLSRLDWFARVPRVEPAQSARSTGCAPRVARPVTRWMRSFLMSCITCTFEENLYRTRQARVDAAAKSITLNDGRLIVYGQIHKTQRSVCTGRIYPGHILEREVGVYYGRHVLHQRALGEFHHPAPTSNTFSSLDDKVSHQILDCHWEGDLLMAYVEILDTTAGRMARDLIVAGIEVRCAARGWATLIMRHGKIYVQEDYELVTFDLEFDVRNAPDLMYPVQRRYENLQPPLTNRLIEQAIASFKREMKFQALDRFVGVNPVGSAYCKMCRLKYGCNFGKTNLTTLPALRGHAEIFARSTQNKDSKAHGEIRDAIDAMLCCSS